jgi:hypothetical protein
MARRYGSAGSGPGRIALSWRLKQAGALAVAVGALMAMAWELPAPVAIVALVFATVVWSVGEGRVKRARAGESAEFEVSRRLRGFGTVVFGWRPPGVRFDVDVVVLEPCLAAIEVKRAGGRMRRRSDGTVLVGGVPIPGDPLRQAVRGAAFVRQTADSEELVGAVLCITGMRQRPRVVEWSGTPVTVCSVRHLRRVLRRIGPRRSRREAKVLAASFVGSQRQ